MQRTGIPATTSLQLAINVETKNADEMLQSQEPLNLTNEQFLSPSVRTKGESMCNADAVYEFKRS